MTPKITRRKTVYSQQIQIQIPRSTLKKLVHKELLKQGVNIPSGATMSFQAYGDPVTFTWSTSKKTSSEEP